MDFFWRWRERLRRLFLKTRVEREVLDEMQFHLDMEAREHERRGLAQPAARRAARLDFGSVERYREEARETRLGHSVDTLLGDARYSVRLLCRHPGFAVAAIGALALGIGSVTAVFSLVSSALLAPLPYQEAERITWIRTSWQGAPVAAISPAEYLDYRNHLRDVFSSVGVYSMGAMNLSPDPAAGVAEAQRLSAVFVSEGVLPALGVEPLLGRNFSQEENERSEQLVVLGERLWRRSFGGRDDIVGSKITLNARTYEVIGVTPESLRLPEEMWLDRSSELYLPQGIDPAAVSNRGSHYLSGVARLRTGVSQDQAAAAVAGLAARFVADYPDAYPADMGFVVEAVPLSAHLRGPMRAPMLALFVGVGLLLVIACANVAGLIVARSDLRTREIALRSSLGAEPRRIIQQVVTESLVLGALGGAFGLGVAALALAAGRYSFPDGFDWASMLRLDLRVALFGSVLAVITGVIFGLVPALALGSLGGGRLVGAAQPSGSTTAAGTPGHKRSRWLLVAAELSLTLVLLVVAGLLLKSFGQLEQVEPGYRTTGIASARVSLPSSDYPADSDRVGFYLQTIENLAARPGIEAAAAVTNLPLATRLGDMNFEIEGREIPEGSRSPAADWQAATPGYFETMGLALLSGRTFVASDRASSTSDPEESLGVVVINRSMADFYWPNESPLGARFSLGGDLTQPRRVEVVGVVGDVKHADLSEAPRPQMYLVHGQFRHWNSGRALSSLEIVVHSRLDAAALRRAVADTVHALDTQLPISDFRTMEQVRARSVSLPRLLMALLGVFAVSALLLAAVGVYGVTAQVVGRRLPEFGLRLALGASRLDILLSIFKGVGVMVGLGLGFGLVAALGATRLVRSLLFQVDPLDPGVLASVGALLLVAALLASLLAARRATSADPTRLLRSE